MSRAEPSAKSAAHVLFVAIGTERVECGLLSGRGRNVHWPDDARFGFDLPRSGGDAALRDVMAQVERELPARCAGRKPREVRALIADIWLAQLSLPWTAAMKRVVTAQAGARAMIDVAGFDGDWAAPRLDDAPYGMPRLAVAYPQAVLAALERLAGSAGARLRSVLPFSVAAWESALPKGRRVLALVDRGLLVLALGAGARGGSVAEVVVRRLAEGDSTPVRALRETWQRACLRQPQLATIEHVPVLDLTDHAGDQASPPFEPLALDGGAAAEVAPALRLAASAQGVRHALDAIPQRAAASTGVRLALALGAALLAAMAGQLISNAQQLDILAVRLETARPVAAPVAVEAAWSREELPKVQAVNAAIRELNLPIAAILRALQPPPDIRVAVLGVDTAAGTEQAGRSVKVVAEAPTGAEMARYVGFVSGRSPFSGAYLTKHEIDEAAAGRPYRFSVDVQWVD